MWRDVTNEYLDKYIHHDDDDDDGGKTFMLFGW